MQHFPQCCEDSATIWMVNWNMLLLLLLTRNFVDFIRSGISHVVYSTRVTPKQESPIKNEMEKSAVRKWYDMRWRWKIIWNVSILNACKSWTKYCRLILRHWIVESMNKFLVSNITWWHHCAVLLLTAAYPGPATYGHFHQILSQQGLSAVLPSSTTTAQKEGRFTAFSTQI